MTHSQPFVDPLVGGRGRPAHHPDAAAARLCPRPLRPWIKTRANQKPSRVFSIWRRKVRDLLPDAPCEECIASGRQRAARRRSAEVDARQGEVLYDRLPARDRQHNDCTVERHLLIATPACWSAMAAMHRDEVVAVTRGAVEVGDCFVEIYGSGPPPCWLGRLLRPGSTSPDAETVPCPERVTFSPWHGRLVQYGHAFGGKRDSLRFA